MQWTRAAAVFGRVESQVKLGEAYAQGRGVRVDRAEAIGWYRRAGRQGHAGAQFALGEMLCFPGTGEAQPVEGVHWFEQAGEAGHFNAQYRLADIYSRGLGVPLSTERTVYWWRRMSASGYVEATRDLAWALSEGWGVARDGAAARAIWTKLAGQGDLEATYQLGRAYAVGEGLPKDPERAVQLWLKAGDQNQRWMPECWFALCRAFARGEGTRRAPVAASQWCRRLTGDTLLRDFKIPDPFDPQGTPPHVIHLARMKQKRTEAEAVLRDLTPELEALARRGDVEAQYQLATAYATGLGAPRDPKTAQAWLRRAAAQGHAIAARQVAPPPDAKPRGTLPLPDYLPRPRQ